MATGVVVGFPVGLLVFSLTQAMIEIQLGFSPAMVGVSMAIWWIGWTIWHSVLFGQREGRLSGGGSIAYRRAFVWDILPGTIIGFSQMLRPAINGPVLESRGWNSIELSWLIGVVLGIGVLGLVISTVIFLAAWSAIGTGRVAFAEEFVVKRQFVPIQSGPYARIRHPLFWSGILLSVSLAILTTQWFCVGLALINVCYGLIYNRLEDRRMKRVFNHRYTEYAEVVPRVVPSRFVQ